MDKKEVCKQYIHLNSLAVQRRKEALDKINKELEPLYQELYDNCGKTGHSWKFSHHNFEGSLRYFRCEHCGMVTREDKM